LIFHKNFHPYLNPNFFFGLGFGSSQIIWIISASDLDPQPVLPTSGKSFLPDQLKNSAADEKIRPHTIISIKG
jgi:hypothetical protein